MKQFRWQGGGYASALLDLAACMAGFGAAALIEYTWTGGLVLQEGSELWLPTWLLSAIIGWFAMVFPESQWHEGVRLWVDGFLSIVGSNLLVQCGLIYLFGVSPASWLVIVMGSALSMAAASLLRTCIPGTRWGSRKGILLVGFDDSMAPMVPWLQNRIVGCLENSSRPLPLNVPLLGGVDSLQGVCETLNPGTIVVSGHPAVGLSPVELLRMHYSGVEVESAPFLYERVLQRVAWQYMHPSELLFYLNPGTSHAMLAFQAVYKNIIGLALRLVTAPVLMLLSFAIVVSTGGPALEHIECLGFQRIPFQLMRFRIHRSDGKLSAVGRLIARLHMTNLPHLINVVRGEMTLFGPPPVRTAFASRLIELLPAYLYRFTVKPGILGWSQADEAEDSQDEISRLERDLYYIRQESPSLDLNILLRTLSPRSPAKTPVKAAHPVVRNS